MIRKIHLLAVLLVFVFLFSGCGSQGGEVPENTQEPVVTKESVVTKEPVVTEESVATEEPVSTQEPIEVPDNEPVHASDDAADNEVNKGTLQEEEIPAVPPKYVALTFDDGPSVTTGKVLDILEEYDIVATFFLIGQNLTKSNEGIVKRQVEMGCEIANHSYSYQSMDTMTAEEIKDSIDKTTERIKEIVDVDILYFRPPNLAISNTMYESIDLAFIQGIGCNDWVESVTAHSRSEAVLKGVKDGTIVLLHDFYGNDQTVEALPAIIEGLMEKGYTFVTLSQLFELKEVDPNVEYKIWTTVK